MGDLMDIAQFQGDIDATFGERDRQRGVPSTIAWLTEELGELAQAVRKGTRDQQVHELGDVFAWLVSLASQLGISMDEAIERYANGCPRCSVTPCVCPTT
jgi:NTP pyrophosphatase (non-canonical NTP hydrolase)